MASRFAVPDARSCRLGHRSRSNIYTADLFKELPPTLISLDLSLDDASSPYHSRSLHLLAQVQLGQRRLNILVVATSGCLGRFVSVAEPVELLSVRGQTTTVQGDDWVDLVDVGAPSSSVPFYALIALYYRVPLGSW